MARLIVSMNLSLDGFIEAQGEDDGSWLQIDEEVHTVFNELAAGAAAFVYGRKVFDVMPPYWPDAAADATKPAHERDYGRIWTDMPKLVVSSSLQETRWNTRVVSEDALGEIERIKQQSSGYLLCYGGAQLVLALQSRSLIDEYALFVHPAALGAGVPFFRVRVPLQLLSSRQFKPGTLLVRYASTPG